VDLKPLTDEENDFVYNRVNLDSGFCFHCLAIKADGMNLQIRSGFHWAHATVDDYKLPDAWNSMDRASEGFVELKVNKSDFQRLYNEQIEV
jgi:hypothetical protein